MAHRVSLKMRERLMVVLTLMLAAVLVAGLFPLPAWGQATAAVNGTVRDSAGAVVANNPDRLGKALSAENGGGANLKYFEGRVPRTEYRLTPAGRRALAHYLNQMEEWIRLTRDR